MAGRARRCSARAAVRRRRAGDAASDTLPTGAWERPPDASAVVVPIARSGETGRAGVLVAGSTRFACFDDDYRGFLALVAGQIAAGIANARRLRGGAPARRGAGRARPRQDGVLLQRQPRVPHAAHAACSGRSRTLVAAPRRCRRRAASSTTACTATRCGCSSWSTRCSTSRASRPAASRRASSRPTSAALTAELASAFRSAIERAGLALRGRLPAARRAGLRRPRHVGEDRPQPALERLQVHVRGRDRGLAVAPRRRRAAELPVADTGVGIPAEELPHAVRALPPRRGDARRGPTRAPASGWRWSRSWCKLHGGTIAVESAARRGHAPSRSPSRFGTAHLPRRARGAGAPARRPRRAPTPYVEEALRWLAEDAGADAVAAEPSAERRSGRRRAGGATRILLADDNADMRDYVRRLLRAALCEVEAVGDGEAGAGRGSATDRPTWCSPT